MSKSIAIKKKYGKNVVMYDSSDSDNNSNSNSNSNSDNEKELPKKVIPKKSVKKSVKKNIKNDDDQNLDENIPSIEQLLINKNYIDLQIYIPKYKNITSNDVNQIINSKPQKIHKEYNYDYIFYDMELMEIILEKIIDNGYVMKKENYIELLKQYGSSSWNMKKITSKKILKNFTIEENEISEWAKFFIKTSLKFFFEYTSLNLDNTKSLENIFCVLMIIGCRHYQLFVNTTKVAITEKCLQYAKTADDKIYIRKQIKSQLSEVKKIKKNAKDDELLKCKSIEEIEEYIDKNDYEITEQTIILACQNNVDKNIINHLLSYKINFNEESVNNIIQNYRENENIESLLLLIGQYGYQFKRSNYIEMFTSNYYASLFSDKNLIKNLILDDELVECAYNANKKFSQKTPQNFEKFLEDIEFLGEQNKVSAEGIIILCCGIGNTNKIKKLTKKYDFKLNAKCLKYLYKEKSNVLKKNIELFKNDKVVPDTDVLLQYIDTFAQGAKQIYLYELLGI